MPEAKIKFKIITPERTVYENEVDSITLPTKQGEITVLPEHIPLVSSLVPGELKIRKGDQELPMAVAGGFIEVKKKPSQVIILADAAERVEEIDEARAEAAKKKAQQLMKERVQDEVSFTEAAVALQRALARLKVARKYRSHRPRHGAGLSEEITTQQ